MCKSDTILKRMHSPLASEYRCKECGGDFLGMKVLFVRLAWPLNRLAADEQKRAL